MDKKKEYYYYDSEGGRHWDYQAEAADLEAEKSFWDKHPGAASTIFLGGTCALGIFGTVVTIELIGWVTARKVVKKLKEA